MAAGDNKLALSHALTLVVQQNLFTSVDPLHSRVP